MDFNFEDEFARGVAIEVLSTMRAACERMMVASKPAETRPPKMDLISWSRKFLPQYMGYSTTDLHRWVAARCDESVENRGSKFNCLGPRDSAKSVYATTAHVLRSIVEQAESLIWIISETREQAQGQLQHIKDELEDNEHLARVYPWACGKGSTWRVNRIVARNGVTVEAFGAGQKVRGRRAGANRPSLVILDDIQSNPVMTSPDRRRKDWDWLQSAVMKAGSSRTNYINLANALHREAIGSVLFKTPGWGSHRFRSIIDWPERMDLWDEWSKIYHDVENPGAKERAKAFHEEHREEMERGASVLWPDRESLYQLMALREEGGRTTFEREKQSRELNPEECEWGEEYFGDACWFEHWPKQWRAKALSLDASKGKRDKAGDYSAFVKGCLGFDGILYVQADLSRRPINQIVRDGIRIVRDFGPTGFGIETNGFQELLCAPFEAGFIEHAVLPPAMLPIENYQDSKEVRIRRLDPWLSTRRIRFMAGCPGTALLVQQLQDFPLGDHDDGPDALEMFVRVLLCLLGMGNMQGTYQGSIA